MNKRFLPITILSAFLLIASATTAQTTESGKKATNQNNAAQETINDAVETTPSTPVKSIPTKSAVVETPKEVKLDPTIQREHIILKAPATTTTVISSTFDAVSINSNTLVIRQIEALKPISEKIEQLENKVNGSSRTNYNTLKEQLKTDYINYIATLEKQSNLEKSAEFKKAIQQEITDVKIKLASL